MFVHFIREDDKITNSVSQPVLYLIKQVKITKITKVIVASAAISLCGLLSSGKGNQEELSMLTKMVLLVVSCLGVVSSLDVCLVGRFF